MPFEAFPDDVVFVIYPEGLLFLTWAVSSVSNAFRFFEEMCDSSKGGGGPCFFIRRPTPIAKIWYPMRRSAAFPQFFIR